MRKLVLKDAMKMAKIIKKANIKDEFAALAKKFTNTQEDQQEVGIEVAVTLAQACGNEGVDKEVYELLNDIFETKDVANMSLEEIGNKFAQLAQENNLLNFFKSAGSLTQ